MARIAETTASTHVSIYDTTLRDGTQGEGVSITARDKIRIAKRLDELGVDFIEGGWPGSNPKDAEFFQRARETEWRHAVITAFGATRRAKLDPEADGSVRALLDSGAAVCTIFGKSWTLHVEEVLRIRLDENLRMIEETVAYLTQNGRRVIYDAEHFFDGYTADAGYAIETLRAAQRGGAEVLVLCDTNGGSLPWQVEAAVSEVGRALEHPLGIHTHNDTDCAVANSLAAVRAGARHVQGTVNGLGERCGNANLSVVIPNLELKLGLRCLPEGRLVEIGETSRFVAEVTNHTLDERMAYVGRSAFAHKAGVHVSAMRRHGASYQHVDPAVVGNTMRVLVSELSGRANVLSKAEELGEALAEGVEDAAVRAIKEAESRGMSYEGAEASVALLLRRRQPDHQTLFEILDYKAEVGRRQGTDTFAEATVKLRAGQDVMHTVAEGNGPVAALDAALRKALTPLFPALEHIHLTDYKVRILDSTGGTEAVTRVLIDFSDLHGSWSTVGASPNIIEASLDAVVDGIEWGLLKTGESRVELDPTDVLVRSVRGRPSDPPPPPSRSHTPDKQ
ncbi:MAG: citramalate synthase [Polyangiaceae bacterium]|nr:citramalate synthase [Polyangiaceae bacterium]